MGKTRPPYPPEFRRGRQGSIGALLDLDARHVRSSRSKAAAVSGDNRRWVAAPDRRAHP